MRRSMSKFPPIDKNPFHNETMISLDDQYLSSSSEYSSVFSASRQPRKRAKLDFLTEEQKTMRRKILNREAAQKARDRKKDLIDYMEKALANLSQENQILRQNNKVLREKFLQQENRLQRMEQEFKSVVQRLESSQDLSKTNKTKIIQLNHQSKVKIEPTCESAVLSVSQQQGMVLFPLLMIVSSLLFKPEPLSHQESQKLLKAFNRLDQSVIRERQFFQKNPALLKKIQLLKSILRKKHGKWKPKLIHF